MKSLTGSESIFDSIRRFDSDGNEYWMARELMPVLGYRKWERFENAISLAQFACQNAKANIDEHFVYFPEPGNSNGSGKLAGNFKLSRFASYLIAMNGDPRKPEIAQAQAYFAVKTREAETIIPVISDVSDDLSVRLRELELENENLKLQVELAQAQDRLSSNQQKLLATVQLLETVSPGLAPLALGKADAVVERIEYVERTITPTETYEGIGITYVQKKYGFKNTAKTWEWLDSVGCGKNSGMWQLQLSAVESHKLPPYALAEIAKKFSDKEGDRQLLLGE
jgi:hypothetical protein